MALPTISGRIRMPDDSVYVGPFKILRRTGPMLNGTTLVGLNPILVTTDTDGDFSLSLHPGVYTLHTLVSGYPGAPQHQVAFRVPNEDDDLNFSDLEFETAMPDPSYFGGTSDGDGGDTPTATTTTAGKVKIAFSEGDPVAALWSSFFGTSSSPVVFRVVSGALRMYVRNADTGEFHQLLCAGTPAYTGVDTTGVAFASLPGA